MTFIHSLCKGACPLMVEQIKGAEQSEAQAAAMDQAQETERVRQVVDGMRGFY